MALQRRKLKVAVGLPEAATLVEELRNFEVRITQAANAVYNARVGAHDDLVLAAALALWGATHQVDNAVQMNYRGTRDVQPYGARRTY